MDLPSGLRRRFEEDERRFAVLLAGLGLDRAGLGRVAAGMRARLRTRAPGSGGAGRPERRGRRV